MFWTSVVQVDVAEQMNKKVDRASLKKLNIIIGCSKLNKSYSTTSVTFECAPHISDIYMFTSILKIFWGLSLKNEYGRIPYIPDIFWQNFFFNFQTLSCKIRPRIMQQIS